MQAWLARLVWSPSYLLLAFASTSSERERFLNTVSLDKYTGWSKRIEYEPGTGSLALFPSMRLETCDEPITSIEATVELETNHIGKGCDRDTYSEKSLHRLCGKSAAVQNKVVLLAY